MFIKSLARFYGRACALRRIRLLCFFFEARIARIQTNWLKEDTNFTLLVNFRRDYFEWKRVVCATRQLAIASSCQVALKSALVSAGSCNPCLAIWIDFCGGLRETWLR